MVGAGSAGGFTPVSNSAENERHLHPRARRAVRRRRPVKVFAPRGSDGLGREVARCLGRALDELEERDFEDGEHKARPMVDVRGEDVFVLHGLHGSPDGSANDRICRLLFLVGACRTNGAARVTAVAPYLAYSRKDRQTKPRDPLTARYLAQLFEAVGTDRLVTLEAHNPAALQNAYRIETVAPDLRGVLLERAAELAGDGTVAVASPDPGGVKRAQLFREALEARLGRTVGFAFMEKRRSGGRVSGSLMAGEVAGARVLIVDDMIASGGTMVRAAEALLSAGARDAWALAAHGLFTRGAETALMSSAMSGWIVTDTVPPFRLQDTPSLSRLEIVSAAPLLAETIRRLHEGLPVTDLFAGGA